MPSTNSRTRLPSRPRILKPALPSRPALAPPTKPKRAGARLTETLGRFLAASLMSRIWPCSMSAALMTSIDTGSSSVSCSVREPLTTTSFKTAICIEFFTRSASVLAYAIEPALQASATSKGSLRKTKGAKTAEAEKCVSGEKNKSAATLKPEKVGKQRLAGCAGSTRPVAS